MAKEDAYFYAQLDGNNVCIGISQLSGEVKAANMIQLTENEYSPELLGKVRFNGKWEDVPAINN